MATTLATIESREVLRCERCQLVQFRTHTGDCRRCHKPLEVEEPVLPATAPRSAQDSSAPQELDVARAVRTLRNARGLSQRQLAGRMGVPRTYISKIENAKAMPTLSSLERLATALEAPMAELVHDARSRREQLLTAVLADEFLCELLPMVCRLDSFQQQVVLSNARDMAREAVSGRPRLARA
jgi:transcriptional regulator with XRE-family HTH domain